MNNKGFTLVELLAVIVLIALISTIAIVSMNGIRGNIDEKIIESNLDLIDSAAKAYGEDHMSEIMNGISYKTVADLKGLTELDIDGKYDEIDLKIYLKNRRASVCISNQDALSELTSTKERFSKYFCNLGDVNDDGEINCDDLSALDSARLTSNPCLTGINCGNSDFEADGEINNQDVTLLDRKLKDELHLTCK